MQAASNLTQGTASLEYKLRLCLEDLGIEDVPLAEMLSANASLQTPNASAVHDPLLKSSFHEATDATGVSVVACGCAVVEGTALDDIFEFTHILGCGRHGGEPASEESAYCIVDGDADCPGAHPSVQFAGRFWMKCVMPDFEALYPEGCELRTPPIDARKRWPEVPPLSLAKPPSPKQVAAAEVAQAPAPAARQYMPLDELRHELAGWSTTLSSEWHASAGNLFLSSTTTTTTALAVVNIDHSGEAPAPSPVVPALDDPPSQEALDAVGA